MNKINKELKFMECKTLEEFINKYKQYHLQDLALRDGISYFDVTTSNVDGTIIGEQFDHPIRMKAFYENNEKFFKEVNEEELLKEVNEKYRNDIERIFNERGLGEDFKKCKEQFGKYYMPYDRERKS